MNDPTMTTEKDLERYACYLADQFRADLLPEVQSIGWQMVWKDLNKVLRRRCPGFSALQYGIALNQGFVNLERCARDQKKHAEQAVSRFCVSSEAAVIPHRECISGGQ
jgi:hypothetical protein